MVGKESSLIEYGTVRSGTLSCDKSCRLLEFYAVLARSRSLGNADWLEYVEEAVIMMVAAVPGGVRRV